MSWLSSARRSVARGIVPAARWIAPSAAGACAGALAGGLFDGAGMDPFPMLATAGFFALLAIPVLVAASLLARGVYAGWQPEKLAADLVEEGGGAPRLAGWVAVAWLGIATIIWAAYQGTWLLAMWTAFKPLGVSFLEPVIAALAAVVVGALSRPCARLFGHIAGKLDARWRRRGHGTLLRPRTIFAGAAVAGLVVLALLWWLFVKPKLGPLDTSVLHAPALALVITWLAHALRRVGGTSFRRVAGYAIGGAAAVVVAAAVFALYWRPSLTLEIWGDRPLAGFAIDHLFDLDAIRGDIPLDEFRPVERPGAPHPDIVLVTIDTVRADHTPPYGGSAPMPILKTIAERGSTFLWAFSPSNVTRRSIPSMVIGLDPNRVRGRVVGWALRVDPRHVLLAERMRAAGYETAGFMCCEGFWGPDARTGLARGLEHVEVEKNGQKLAVMARGWLDARERTSPTRPLFLWMHILEPHDWSSVEILDEAERRRLYDRSLTSSDAMLGVVVAAFAGRAPDRAPIVIVTADHGEALGDHGHPFHSTDLYNSQVHIPLVMAGPGIKQQRIAETVSLTDMVPTIIDLAGYQPPSLDGRSVRDLTTGRPSLPNYGIAYAAMIKDRSNPGGITAIVKGNWKLIETEVGLELYDIHADPDERVNLVNLHAPSAHELKRLLDARNAAGEGSPFAH